jgi:hypothetical protein
MIFLFGFSLFLVLIGNAISFSYIVMTSKSKGIFFGPSHDTQCLNYRRMSGLRKRVHITLRKVHKTSPIKLKKLEHKKG